MDPCSAFLDKSRLRWLAPFRYSAHTQSLKHPSYRVLQISNLGLLEIDELGIHVASCRRELEVGRPNSLAVGIDVSGSVQVETGDWLPIDEQLDGTFEREAVGSINVQHCWKSLDSVDVDVGDQRGCAVARAPCDNLAGLDPEIALSGLERLKNLCGNSPGRC